MDEIGATRLVIRCLVAESMEELAKKNVKHLHHLFFNMSLLGKFRCPKIHPTKIPTSHMTSQVAPQVARMASYVFGMWLPLSC